MPSLAILNLVLAALTVFAVAFPLIVGGRLERAGAAVFGLGTALTWGVQFLVGSQAPVSAFMVIDFGMALAFAAILFVDREKLWPGAAACAQLLVFVFSASRTINFPLSDLALLMMLNVSGVGVILSLVVGAAAHRWGPKDAYEAAAFA